MTSQENKTKYINLMDGKVCEFISEEDGLVTFRYEGRETLRFLGRSEFDKRFVLQPDAPAFSSCCPCGDDDGQWCSLPGCPFPKPSKANTLSHGLDVAPLFRFLVEGDIIAATDEFIGDDGSTWMLPAGWEIGMEYPAKVFKSARRLVSPAPSSHVAGQFDGTIDSDSPLEAAAREAGWALTTLVDISDWQRRDQISAIITRLAAALLDADRSAPPQHVSLADYATRLFDLHGFMLLETYRGKHAVTVTFPDLEEAQQFHNALVELSQHRPIVSPRGEADA